MRRSWNEVRRYTPATARRLVEAAGLRAERVSFVFASVFPLVACGPARAARDTPLPIWSVVPTVDIAVPLHR